MTIVAEQTITGSTTSGNITLPSWTPGANQLCQLFIAQRNESIAPSVSGNGLTWVEVENVDNTQGQNGVSVWRAMGATPTTGSITVTLSGNSLPAFAVAICFSGVDTSGTNGSGAVEASGTAAGPATDNADMQVSVTTVTANAWAVAVGTYRNNTFTVPGGQTGLSVGNAAGTGGDTTTCSVWYKSVASPGSTTLGGTGCINSAADWCCIAVSIKPESTGVAGELTKTLGALTVDATGTVAVAGELTKTLGALTVDATG
ncbi:MAG TPA: hypothetical protein PKH77_17755, partial [Anaerolineae bacterium]|nr:hypothetical protein [Anaerolineae bacterium]